MLLKIYKSEAGHMVLHVRDESESLIKSSAVTICYFPESQVPWVASVNTALGGSFLADDESKLMATRVLSTLWPIPRPPVVTISDLIDYTWANGRHILAACGYGDNADDGDAQPQQVMA